MTEDEREDQAHVLNSLIDEHRRLIRELAAETSIPPQLLPYPLDDDVEEFDARLSWRTV